jgi:hypothetical protein
MIASHHTIKNLAGTGAAQKGKKVFRWKFFVCSMKTENKRGRDAATMYSIK